MSSYAEVEAELAAWVADQAWVTGDGPKAIFASAVDWLREHQALLPGPRTLVRVVTDGRQAADQRLWSQLTDQLTAGSASALLALLDVPEGKRRVSELERLRRGVFRTSSKGMLDALERLTDLIGLGGQSLDVSIPANPPPPLQPSPPTANAEWSGPWPPSPRRPPPQLPPAEPRPRPAPPSAPPANKPQPTRQAKPHTVPPRLAHPPSSYPTPLPPTRRATPPRPPLTSPHRALPDTATAIPRHNLTYRSPPAPDTTTLRLPPADENHSPHRAHPAPPPPTPCPPPPTTTKHPLASRHRPPPRPHRRHRHRRRRQRQPPQHKPPTSWSPQPPPAPPRRRSPPPGSAAGTRPQQPRARRNNPAPA
uniref:TnpA n=1 Tax=Rhodococcus sp. B2 TaxID=1185468 RepID=A0A8A6W4L5_9NOCA|nr:TnpA [Rhodococcus sp. B2]